MENLKPLFENGVPNVGLTTELSAAEVKVDEEVNTNGN